MGGLVVKAFGWRALFLALGFGSLIWVIPWFVWGPRDRALAISHSALAPSMLEIAGKRDAWGTFLGLFCGNYVWYFLLTWLPSYLVNERHFSMSKMAIMGSLPFFGIALTSMLGGYISDRMIANGGSPTRVRKGFVVMGLLLGTLMLPAAIIQDENLSMAVLIAASLCFGLYSSNLWAVTQTLAGPAASGKWTGMQNGFGNLGGVVAPALTGFIVDRTGSYQMAFVAVACMLVGGAACFQFIVGPVKPIEWSNRNNSGQATAA